MKRIKKRIAFTLAEVLITIGIIGVVSILTLPTLLTNIDSRVKGNQSKVIESKLTKSLNLLNSQENGLSHSYGSTEEFLKSLSKYLKITTICSMDELNNCFSYEVITVDQNGGTVNSVPISSLTTGKKLRLGKGFEDTAGMVLGDGTPMIVSYNQNCNSDPDVTYTSINPCLAGIYDLNGNSGPNKYGTKLSATKTSYTSDVRSFNGASLGCLAILNNVCVTRKAVLSSDLMATMDESEIPKARFIQEKYNRDFLYYDITKLGSNWCEEQGTRMPTVEDMWQMAKILYDNEGVTKWSSFTANINESLAKSLGVLSENYYVFSDAYAGNVCAHARMFKGTYTTTTSCFKKIKNYKGDINSGLLMCVE